MGDIRLICVVFGVQCFFATGLSYTCLLHCESGGARLLVSTVMLRPSLG